MSLSGTKDLLPHPAISIFCIGLALGCTPCILSEEDNTFDRNFDEVPQPDPAPTLTPSIHFQHGLLEDGGHLQYGDKMVIEVRYQPCDGELSLEADGEALGEFLTLPSDNGGALFDVSLLFEGPSEAVPLSLSAHHRCRGAALASSEPADATLVPNEALVPALEGEYRLVGGDLFMLDEAGIHTVSTRAGTVEILTSGVLDLPGEDIGRIESSPEGRLFIEDTRGNFAVLDIETLETLLTSSGDASRMSHFLRVPSDAEQGERLFALSLHIESQTLSLVEVDLLTGEVIASAALPSERLLANPALSEDGAAIKIAQQVSALTRTEIVETLIGTTAEDAAFPIITTETLHTTDSPDSPYRQGAYVDEGRWFIAAFTDADGTPALLGVPRGPEAQSWTLTTEGAVLDWSELDSARLWLATAGEITILDFEGNPERALTLPASVTIERVQADPAGEKGLALTLSGDEASSWRWLDLALDPVLDLGVHEGPFGLFWEAGRAPVLLVSGLGTSLASDGAALVRLSE